MAPKSRNMASPCCTDKFGVITVVFSNFVKKAD